MRTFAVALTSACAGAAAVGLLWSATRETTLPTLSETSTASATAAATVAPPTVTTLTNSPAGKSCDPVTVKLPTVGSPPESGGEREAVERLGDDLFQNGAEWEAEHGERRASAAVIVKRRKALDKYLEGDPDNAWNQAVTKNLDRILQNSDTHIATSECSTRACRVELLHETNGTALDLSPESLMAGAPGTFMDTVIDRSDDDGQLHTFVYYRKPEALPKEQREAAAELARQQEIVANFDSK